MRVITRVDEMQKYSRFLREKGKTIGFIPTMGYLHEGHLSLVKHAKRECDITIMSIFVNPIQFCPGEDYKKYPRDMKRDKILARKIGLDILFIPSRDEMYPKGYSTNVEVIGRFTNSLCGASRPGHFKGVTTVVAKLFNIVNPTRGYFGQKDAQQAIVIKRMAKDLNIPVEIIMCPTVREKNGLAMSSRNVYLLGPRRDEARKLFQSLLEAKKMIASGIYQASRIKEGMKRILKSAKSIKIDYIEVVDGTTLESLKTIKKGALILAAIIVGKTRLIDNIIIK